MVTHPFNPCQISNYVLFFGGPGTEEVRQQTAVDQKKTICPCGLLAGPLEISGSILWCVGVSKEPAKGARDAPGKQCFGVPT